MRKAGREGIVDATLDVIASRGAVAATLRAIASRAGVTEAAIYKHFRSKAELVDAVFLRCAELLYGHLSEAGEGVLDPIERLVALAQGLLDFALLYRREYRLIASVHLHQLRLKRVPTERRPKDLFLEAAREIMGRDANSDAVEALVGAIIGAAMGVILMLDVGAISDVLVARTQIAQAARCLAAAQASRNREPKEEI